MLPLQIARRFLWRSKAQTALIVLGIAVGIGTQVFVGSLISSLQASLIDTTVGSRPHVILEPGVEGELVTFDAELRTLLAADDAIVAVAPVHVVAMLAASADGTDPLVVRLVDPSARDGIYDIEQRIVDGTGGMGPGEIVVGLEFAEEAGVGVGDGLDMLTETGDEIAVTVVGIFDLGAAAANLGTAFAAPDMARGVLDLPSEAFDAIELQVADVFDSEAVAERLDRLAGVRARDWQAENSELLAGLRSQSVSSIMIQVFVVIAVGLGIASTLAIAAVQKTRQIGILKALGLTDRRSGAVFLWQAAMLGSAGTALGLGLGWALIAGFDAAAAGSEALFPVSVEPAFAVISAAIGIGISLASAVIPYRSTTRVDPITVIQNG